MMRTTRVRVDLGLDNLHFFITTYGDMDPLMKELVDHVSVIDYYWCGMYIDFRSTGMNTVNLELDGKCIWRGQIGSMSNTVANKLIEDLKLCGLDGKILREAVTTNQ